MTHKSCGKTGGGEETAGTTAKPETSVPHVTHDRNEWKGPNGVTSAKTYSKPKK